MPEDVIKPFTERKYEGPPATPDNFTQAFPDFEKAATAQSSATAGIGVRLPYAQERVRALRPLDQNSQRNLDELKRQMRSTPPKPATVVNLHPFPLQFPATDLFLRGIIVPPCNPGMDFAWHHIRVWSADKKYTEDAANLVFGAILPIHKAAQFLVAFGNPEVYGGGLIIYEGDSHPTKAGMVETYYQNGAPITDARPGVELDQEGHEEHIIQQVPIRRNVMELIDEQTKHRNAFYMAQVQEADDNWKSGERNRKRLVTDRHRLMQDVLLAQGILPRKLEWNLSTRLEEGLSENNCQCGNPVKAGSYKCGSCARIIDPLAAYLDAAIEYSHVSMERMTAEQWATADEEQERRQSARERAKELREKAAEKASKKKT